MPTTLGRRDTGTATTVAEAVPRLGETVARVAAAPSLRRFSPPPGESESMDAGHRKYIHRYGSATFTGDQVYESPLRCPDRYAAESMRMAISQAREQHDTLGVLWLCSIHGVPQV